MKSKEKFIIYHCINPSIIWYISSLAYYPYPDSDWILGPGEIQNKSKAMKFCKVKAEKIAKILSEQVDEYGFSSNYQVKELK